MTRTHSSHPSHPSHTKHSGHTTLTTFATLTTLLLACATLTPTLAQAQSNVTIYGRLDLGVRYNTNVNAAGGSLTELASGSTSSSRWGVKGSEDLGEGMKAFFVLEGGINPDTGTAAQSGRLFGRTSIVGLSGQWGTLSMGRQNSLAYDMTPLGDPFGWANLNEGGFFYDNYASKRWDNTIKYNHKMGAVGGTVSGAVMLGLGEQAGNAKAKRNLGASLGYESGPLAMGGVYQTLRNANGAVERKLFALSAAYDIAPVKLFLGYLDHRSDTTIQKNVIWTSGLSYAATPVIDLYGAYYLDQQRNPGGNKKLLVGMINYKFSKRTNAYFQADHGNTNDAYASNIFDDQGFKYPAGIRNRTSATLGLRHQF